MYLFVEKGMRVVFLSLLKDVVKPIINTRNHIRIVKQVNISHIWMQIKLSCWAMSPYLSYNEFKWLSQKEIDKINLNGFNENSLDGYTLEVHLEYPDKLHELHNDYALAPQKVEISHDIRN